MPLPIEDYAYIADCHTGALVGRVGDVTTVVRGYGIVLMVLALGALVGLLRPERAAAPVPSLEAVRS